MLGIIKPKSESLQSQIRQSKKELDAAFEAAKKHHEEQLCYKEMLEVMCHAAGGIICRKDSEGRFLFLNEYCCTHFFGLPENCLNQAVGLTDIDLLNAYRENTGKEHTFGDICVSTDDHARSQGRRCMYIEMGRIDGRDVVLKMIKTPLEDGGIVCFGWDITIKCNDTMRVLKDMILDKKIVQLDDTVYWIRDFETCAGII